MFILCVYTPLLFIMVSFGPTEKIRQVGTSGCPEQHIIIISHINIFYESILEKQVWYAPRWVETETCLLQNVLQQRKLQKLPR